MKRGRQLAPAPAEESADIDRILKEKGTAASKKYLCAWMDGAEPQWVEAKYLQGTVALEEWEEACEVVPELFDSEEDVAKKCAVLAGWWRASQRTSILVGAGISASVLPTFRGQGGLWTKSAAPMSKKSKAAGAACSRPQPTASHALLLKLEEAGRVNFVASQNYDDLFREFPKAKLSELHGNIYTETCRGCGDVYHRDFEVCCCEALAHRVIQFYPEFSRAFSDFANFYNEPTRMQVELPNSKDHATGRACEKCGGALFDNLVHFGEALPWHALTMANAKFLGADLSIAIGTSLQVEPAASLPFKSKRRKKNPPRPRAVIVNLQPTRLDAEADLVIRARSDDVLGRVCKALGL